jgi:sigma-B regulation protein RsbU (phosphoserine phosphatase)
MTGTLRLRVSPPGAAVFHHDCQGKEVVLGRSSRAGLVIPDRFLSRLHARLLQRDDGWYVEDLGSRNPTLLNGEKVETPTKLGPGDVLRLAETVVVVEGGQDDQGVGGSDSVFLSTRAVSGREAGKAVLEDASRLKLLNEVHRALAQPITIEELLDLILDRAFVHLRPEEAAVFLKEAGGGFRRAAARRAPGLAGEVLYSRRLIQEVTDKGIAALVLDAGSDERFARAESILAAGVRSLLAAPLVDTDGCHGLVVLYSRAEVRQFTQEDLDLLVTLASAATLRLRNLALGEEAAQRRVLERELGLAHQIQMAMLPRNLPRRAEVELAAAVKPARSVGGDLYDFRLEGDDLWFMVGDVSGKGVAAALFMAVTKTLFQALVPGRPSLEGALERINDELARDNDRGMFVTAFAGRLDLRSGEVAWVNAGHNPPIRVSPGGRLESVEGARGLALGVMEAQAYTVERLRLSPGEALFLYTDGVVEAIDSAEEAFSASRLEEYLRESAACPVARLVQGVFERVQAFAGSAPPFDDMTALALRYRPPAAAA